MRPDFKINVCLVLIADAVFVPCQMKHNDCLLLVDGSGKGGDRESLCFECKNFSQFLESSYVYNGFGVLVSKIETDHCLKLFVLLGLK